MSDSQFAPSDDSITIQQLTLNPYPIYERLRAKQPVLRVTSLGRTFLTKAADTAMVKDNAELFSSDDPNTPMKRAFLAHTLMRKDGEAHKRERMAMMASLMPKTIINHWAPMYEKFAEEYVGRLPRGETVDLFGGLAGPIAARMLGEIMGIPDATDEELQRWSQVLIDGAGNFGWRPEPFADSDKANIEMDRCILANAERLKAEPDPSALSVMLQQNDPIPMSQMISNIKIAIGGGINEPRDALLTILYGLLTNQDQLEVIKQENKWAAAFEEGVRWVAPIQASSRLVIADTMIRGFHIPKGDTVMTIQASACHDEELYDEPEKYNALRGELKHQAFGNGAHFCAGAHVSRRTVGAILLPLLFDRFPEMHIADPSVVQWRGFGFRGPVNLPVTLK